ncbi:EVE domain-containing protein [Segniliparus rugosus]|uniref:UPF0310 protein HMPREF9336_03021 n=1 Tax=Segniliparus rugosus (strain ATCC BAA-974 / DSM 45345 / CCUG 50838 / CIP 108380 / JCM 13579 / CDC 945) TaxID=679197 RepID=E5XU49_SEGRC|nr:EVE domain-containing protein [Segniliparus rugosus]EFV12112.1 hypothetical protein HMPREF9336_03021 [Segniliparus rugosus ATCC BAA-974]
MRHWLGVVSHEHVRRGVELGFAQANHGKRNLLARMRRGDWLVYYSSRERIRDGAQVHAFTAIGQVADDEPWQADEGRLSPSGASGDFVRESCPRPWRRRVQYDRTASIVPIAALRERLDLASGPHWGIQLRRGLIELGEDDFRLIHGAMVLGSTGQALGKAG